MKCVIVIDGETAEDMFSAGVKDLMNYFLPKSLIKKKDIVSLRFEELQRNGEIIKGMERFNGESYVVITHKDNYKRKEQ